MDSCTVKIRLPDGSTIEGQWDSSALLADVLQFIIEKTGNDKILLSVPHPRVVFDDVQIASLTLADAGLCPKGVLIAQKGISTDMKQDTTPYQKPGVIHVKSESEYEKAKSVKNNLVVVDFSAEWCGPCKMIAPVFEKMAEKTPNVVFIHVDVDKVKVADAQDVSGIPTFKFFKNKQLVHEFSGADANELQSCVNKYK